MNGSINLAGEALDICNGLCAVRLNLACYVSSKSRLQLSFAIVRPQAFLARPHLQLRVWSVCAYRQVFGIAIGAVYCLDGLAIEVSKLRKAGLKPVKKIAIISA